MHPIQINDPSLEAARWIYSETARVVLPFNSEIASLKSDRDTDRAWRGVKYRKITRKQTGVDNSKRNGTTATKDKQRRPTEKWTTGHPKTRRT